jgi:hypothetical protein
MRPYLICVAVLVCCLWALLEQRQPIASQAASRQDSPHLEAGKLDAQELAEILGISIWTFRYSGGRVRCWLEINENGVTSKEPPSGVQDPNKGNAKAKEGKIVLWWRQGQLGLRINSGTASSPYSKTLPNDALWWGWKSSFGRTNLASAPAATKPGEEITLLRHEAEEFKGTAKDPKAPRKVVIVLKAKFPEE